MQEEAARGEGTKRTGDEGSGAEADSGTVCVWRRCRVKGRAATEERHANDDAVVVEWDDEVGGQVRREDSGVFFLFQCHLPSVSIAHQNFSCVRPILLLLSSPPR